VAPPISKEHTPTSRAELRRELRERRRALTAHERAYAQTRLTRAVLRLPAYRKARRIAVYFSVDGEADVGAVLAHAHAQHKRVYAPVLAGRGLRFLELAAGTPMTRNRFGIIEPSGGNELDPRRLDLVLTPLVGVDTHGTRLGMGKGYYDRTFSFLRLRRHWIRPRLLGIGFAFQLIDELAAQPWDVQLWRAITDAGIHHFDAESRP